MTALFSAHSSKGTQKSALPGSFAHRAPLDAGEEGGPVGKPPPISPPAAVRVKMVLGFTCAASPRPPQAPGQVRLCACGDPSFFGSPHPAQPLRALTQQRKNPGEKPEEKQEQGGSHRRGSARGAPRLGGEGVPPGRSSALGKGWWIRGKLWAPNDKEISCHMGRFEITGIRSSNFAFLS